MRKGWGALLVIYLFISLLTLHVAVNPAATIRIINLDNPNPADLVSPSSHPFTPNKQDTLLYQNTKDTPRTSQPPPPAAHNAFWNRTFGGANSDSGEMVVECSGGGYIITGQTSSFGAGGDDAWLIRTDASGNHLWNRTFGGTSDDIFSSVVECSFGFAFAGYTYSYGAGNSDFWLVRTDASGNLIWQYTFGGSHYDHGITVVECSGGGFAITGDTWNFGAVHGDAWLVRTDASGNHLWNRTFGGPEYEVGVSLVECSGGGFAITGWTYSFGADGDDAWLIRTDASGNLLWQRTFGGNWDDSGRAVVECSGGGFAITGSTSSFGAGNDDAWLIRTDASGNLLWQRTFGGYLNDYGFSLVECSGGGFAITGQTRNFGAGLGDAWLVRTDASGNHLWNRTFGGPEYETGNSVVEYGGSFTITGWTRSYGAGDTDVWLVRVRMPVWVEMPTNQTVEWCNSFYYDLNATSEAGIDQWWLNDTAHFITDVAGVITNVTPLAMGVYGLQVFVNDTLGNELSAEFTVTMQDTLGPVWLIAPTDQVVEYGASLSLQLSASDPSGVDHWSVNDITHFAISSTGLLTSLNTLAVGDYDIQVTVSDIYNNDRSATCTISVQDTTAPTWVTQPSNYVLAYGETLSSQLNATDLSGIDSWTVNNTWHFAISSTGLLTSVGILNPGVYGLSVTVRDPYSNAQSATCTVRVEEIPETPQIPGFPLAAIILGMTATLGLLIIIRRQRKSN